MDLPSSGHDPVLLAETMESLGVAPGKTIIDCTLGRGGHAIAIAQQLGPDGLLIGLDVDPKNLEFAAARLANLSCPTRLFHANFAELRMVLKEIQINSVDGILADLGISTNQLFDETYGLSFERNTPLDMRIDPRLHRSAAELVNKLPERDLANVLYELAQERYSRRIARKIVELRSRSPINTTEALAALVRRSIGGPAAAGGRKSGPRIDPATRTFLALRMAVNHEVENLVKLLDLGPKALKVGGRMAVISFQSTEDRACKQAFRSLEQTGVVTVLTKKPLVPTSEETARNPRARSSRLRAIQRLR